MNSSYITSVVFPSWLYAFLPGYNDAVFCVRTRKIAKFKAKQNT